MLVLTALLLTAAPPTLLKSVAVPARPAEVWKAWTTKEGVQTFFAPDARIELKLQGAYEPLFMPEAPEGQRGAEGCQVLAYTAPSRLQFSWGFPPNVPAARAKGEKTTVTVRLVPEGTGTRVALTHEGWKDDADHLQARAYFDDAWTLVLWRLKKRFTDGPIDWKKPYALPEVSSLKWLEGTWRSDSGGPRLESWVLSGDALLGTSRDATVKPAFHELAVVEREDDVLVMRMRMLAGWGAAPEPRRLVLSESKPDFARFTEVGGTTLTYQRPSPDRLTISLDAPAKKETFTFVRAASEVPAVAPAAPTPPPAPAPKPKTAPKAPPAPAK